MFCKFLDVPPFNPDKPLSPSLTQRRALALVALVSIARIADAVVVDPHATVHGVIQLNWPTILNWMKYFYYEVTTEASKSYLLVSVFTVISLVVMKVARNTHLFEQAVLKDNLLNLIIKVWLKTDDSPLYDIAHHYRVTTYSFEAFSILSEQDERLAADARDMILREASGDAGAMTKRLTRQLKNPAKASKECYQLVLFTAGFIAHLAIADRLQVLPSAFMDSFLKDDLVQLMTQLLSFLSEDLARPCERQAFPEVSCSFLIRQCMLTLQCCVRARNGPHWTAVMLNGGLLRSIAGLVSFPQHRETFQGSVLEMMLTQEIPRSFCHRFVVTAAIKAVKEITEDGSAKKLESSYAKEAWANFEAVILDRTVFNAIYERDFAGQDILQCFNVSRIRFVRAPIGSLFSVPQR